MESSETRAEAECWKGQKKKHGGRKEKRKMTQVFTSDQRDQQSRPAAARNLYFYTVQLVVGRDSFNNTQQQQVYKKPKRKQNKEHRSKSIEFSHRHCFSPKELKKSLVWLAALDQSREKNFPPKVPRHHGDRCHSRDGQSCDLAKKGGLRLIIGCV